MHKKILMSALIGIILVGGIGVTIAYSKENTTKHNKTLLSKNINLDSITKNNKVKIKNVIYPNTIIIKNNNSQNEMYLIGDGVQSWISKTQFNYSKFNSKETELTKAQLAKIKYNQGMLFYSFIDVNGVYATHKNITADELNKTAIVVKQQLSGNWVPPTSGIGQIK